MRIRVLIQIPHRKLTDRGSYYAGDGRPGGSTNLLPDGGEKPRGRRRRRTGARTAASSNKVVERHRLQIRPGGEARRCERGNEEDFVYLVGASDRQAAWETRRMMIVFQLFLHPVLTQLGRKLSISWV
jgi:hypothetical protein